MLNKKQISVAVRTLCLLSAFGGSVAYGAISQTPLFLAQHPYPNIMFTLDNSGSMDWDFMPDSAYREYGRNNPVKFTSLNDDALVAYHRTAAFNGMFYNPAIRYDPWAYADGSPFPASVPNAAVDDARASNGSVTDLTVPDVCTYQGRNPRNCPDGYLQRKYMAFYYVYKGSGSTDDVSNYTRVTIDANWTPPATKPTDRTDCAGGNCTWNDELKNFSNWYTYYRKRIFTAIAGVSQAFSALDGKQRVGYGTINNPLIARGNGGGLTVDGVFTANPYTVLLGVRDFVGNDRTAFFNKLFVNVTPSGGTPLRRAMDDVGQYFMRTDDLGPWAEKPGVSRGVELSCRKSFHILMTDGLWNGDAGSSDDARTVAARKADNVDGPVYVNPKDNTTYQYKAGDAANKIFYNSAESTLSDVAMYYWNHDLYPDLDNKVPTTGSDPAFWQHLAQYTIGLGVDGTLHFPGDEAALRSGQKVWPDPGGGGDNAEAVDDLWHAAINGHGQYFSAKNPKAFRDGLTGALKDIDDQTAVASTVALNFDQVGPTGNQSFVPSFTSGTWTGHLIARDLGATGDIGTTGKWDAAGELPAWNSRNIVTLSSDNGTGVLFTFATLGSAQKTQVTADVVDYVRGNSAKEKVNGGTFRNRSELVNKGAGGLTFPSGKNYAIPNKLGDIVGSSPIYVYKLDDGYNALSGYRDFVKGKTARKPMLYAGANDGMLHGFDAATGAETFAYVPKSVYSYLSQLTDQNYQHHFYVDGKLNEGDAYSTGAAKWKTLLSGSTGAGARGVFMLDVTDPVVNATPAGAAASVLWELSGEGAGGDADLGYMLGKTEVVHLQNGAWAAIFGNGYQSSSGKAVLYVVDAFTGNAISGVPSKITLDTGANGANGLSTPALLFNARRELVAAYAGDLQGNLWKVNFGANGAGTIAYANKPLFTAKDKAGTPAPQPIIQRPALGIHPWGGYMVMFGTGKYFDPNDQNSTQLQTAYGIWDNNDSEIAPSNVRNASLQEQTLTTQTGGGSLTSITVDWHNKRGWFVDLTLLSGSRAVGDPYVTDERTFYLTAFTPVASPCDFGGKSQLMSFDYLSGGATQVFDSSTAPGHLSVIDTGATVSDPRIIRIPAEPRTPPCTGAGCTTLPPASCGTRKVLVSQLDGTVTERVVNNPCVAPRRVWHQLDVNY